MKAAVLSVPVLSPRSSSDGERIHNERLITDFRPVAQFGRAAVSKTAGWGFDSLLACQIGAQEEVLDKLKLAAAALIVVAAVAVFYVFGGSSALLRTGIVIVSVIVGAGVALTSEPGRNAWQFAVGMRTEVRKVVWPSRRETIQSTMVVIALVILIGLYLWLLDMLSLWTVYDLILGIKG